MTHTITMTHTFKMNFPTLWRKWILECIRATTASVLVNGCPMDEFPMERWLR